MRSCNLCNGIKFTLLYEIHNTFGTFKIVSCNNCKLVFVHPLPSELEIKNLYNKDYFSFYKDSESKASLQRSVTFDLEIKEITNFQKKFLFSKKVLDVGCGGGFYLSRYDTSWKTIGYDPNPQARKYANKIGIKVKSSLSKVGNQFGLIVVRGTLEHMPNPKQVLTDLYDLLEFGGMIVINTPNIQSLSARIYKDKFRFISPPHHLYYFSPKTISKFLYDAGFELLTISYHYFDTPYFSIKDTFQLFTDFISNNLKNRVSPPYWGNIMDVYALK